MCVCLLCVCVCVCQLLVQKGGNLQARRASLKRSGLSPFLTVFHPAATSVWKFDVFEVDLWIRSLPSLATASS